MSFFVDIGNSVRSHSVLKVLRMCAVVDGNSGVGDDGNATAVRFMQFALFYSIFSCSSNFILHKVNHIKIRVNLMISVSNTLALTLN